MMKAVIVDGKYFKHDMKYERETLAAHGIELVVTQVNNDEEYIEACKDADAVLICYADTNRNVISHLKKAKLLIRYGVGFEVIDVKAATDYGIAVCNVPHYCTEEVAVQAVALFMACLRQTTLNNKMVHQGEWLHKKNWPYKRLSNLTIGVIGFGKISKQICKYLSVFGCKLMAYDPFLDDAVFAENGVIRATKEELCSTCDAIIVQLPLNEGTFHILDKAEFDLMKKGVYIVNTGRGGLINTEALCDAIDNGTVAAAGLDVVEGEPLTDPNARILQYDCVTLCPHHGAQSDAAGVDLILQVIDTVIKVLEGDLPYNVLNRAELLAKKGE